MERTTTEREKCPAAPHTLILENRRSLTVTGVSNVDSFDEQTVVADTSMGELTIRGEQLNISQLNTETGELSLEGEIGALSYAEQSGEKGGFLSRLFR